MDFGVWHKYCAITDFDYELTLNNQPHKDQEVILTEKLLNLLGLDVSVTRCE